MGEYTHEGSRRVISDRAKISYEMLSVEKRVTKDSIPAFIWHTVEDNCVPLENSLMLAEAYRRAGVPFSMIVFEKGWHGMSLCNEETDNRDECDLKNSFIGKWFELAIDWLSSRNFSMITLK
jgi:dipeptidyl aminopeptidase/acylaminoacyl peptidase